MNREESGYRNKIAELHSEIEDKAKELQFKIENLDAIKKQISEGQIKRGDILKLVDEKKKEMELIDNAIKTKNKELIEGLQPKQKIAEELKNQIISLKSTLDSLGLEEFSKRIEENKKLIVENERILKDKEKIEKSLSILSSNADNLKNQIKDMQDSKNKLSQELQNMGDEYLFMQKQIQGINEKMEKVRFYARRLAKAGGKDLGELNDLGPFKFFPSDKLKAKLKKDEQKNK